MVSFTELFESGGIECHLFREVGSSEVMYQCGRLIKGGGILTDALILNGMLFQAKVHMVTIEQIRDTTPFVDLASAFSLKEIDQQLGSNEEDKLAQLLRGFADFSITCGELEIDEASAEYLRYNLQEVVNFLAPMLRQNRLRIYRHRQSLEEKGAFVFLDSKELYFFYPVFGLKAFATYAGGFVPWRPGMYLPGLEPRVQAQPMRKTLKRVVSKVTARPVPELRNPPKSSTDHEDEDEDPSEYPSSELGASYPNKYPRADLIADPSAAYSSWFSSASGYANPSAACSSQVSSASGYADPSAAYSSQVSSASGYADPSAAYSGQFSSASGYVDPSVYPGASSNAYSGFFPDEFTASFHQE